MNSINLKYHTKSKKYISHNNNAENFKFTNFENSQIFNIYKFSIVMNFLNLWISYYCEFSGFKNLLSLKFFLNYEFYKFTKIEV